jgi:hypothetical protein
MTAPLPSPYLSPTAGLFNAMVRHLNRGYRAHIAELAEDLAKEIERGYQLRTTAAFADSERSGYVDRTGLGA